MTDDIVPGPADGDNRRVRPVFDEHVVVGGVGSDGFVAGAPYAGTPYGGPQAGQFPPVGRFPQAGDAAQWVLRRYLLTRAVGASILRTVYLFGAGLLVLALLAWFVGVHWLAVLIGLAAVAVLLVRAALSAVQRRLSGIDAMGPAGRRVEALVGQTRRSVRAELRRVGLPGAPWGPTVIGVRLLRRKRRAETIRRLTRFDLTQVVPSSTLDELYLLLRDAPRA